MKEAPRMNRMPDHPMVDDHFLHDVFLAAVEDKNDRLHLEASIKQLNQELAEFCAFMKDVDEGTIKVLFNKEICLSERRTKFYYIRADYAWQKGPICQWNKRVNKDPFCLIYGFRFYPNGCLQYAQSQEAGFSFDDQGKVRAYWYGSKELTLAANGKMQCCSQRKR